MPAARDGLTMTFSEDPVYAGLRDLHAKARLKKVLAQAWSDWCGRAPAAIRVELCQTDYQPFMRGWVRVRAEVSLDPGSSIALDVVLHVFALPEIAERAAENGRQLRVLPCEGPPMFVHDDLNLVGWTLPNGPDLRGLAQILRPEALGLLLEDCLGNKPDPKAFSSPALHLYEPSVHAIIHWRHREDASVLTARLTDDDSSMVAYSNAAKASAALSCGALGVRAPMPITFHRGLKTLVATDAGGTPLRDCIDGGQALDAFRAAGRAVAALHRSSIAPSSFWSADRECVALTRQTDGIGHALPDLTPRLNGIVNELVRRPGLRGVEEAPIHGALTCDEISYDDGQVGFTGWGALALGDPLHDPGRLVGHLAYLAVIGKISRERGLACIDAFRRGYCDVGGAEFVTERLGWHMAVSLLLIGKRHSMRRLADGWTGHIRSVVEEAERALSAQSQFLHAVARDAGGVGGRAA